MKRMPRILIVLLGVALIGLLAAMALSYLLHDHWDRRVLVTLADGTKLDVRHQGSEWRYFSGGHGFGFGGGDRHERLDFDRGGKKYVWEGLYEPVSIQFDQESPLIVVFDRESPLSEWQLRYYRFSGEWTERPLQEYPAGLALLNMWGHDPNQFAFCDPENRRFQDSLTARFWLCISTQKPYLEIAQESASPTFLREFITTARQ